MFWKVNLSDTCISIPRLSILSFNLNIFVYFMCVCVYVSVYAYIFISTCMIRSRYSNPIFLFLKILMFLITISKTLISDTLISWLFLKFCRNISAFEKILGNYVFKLQDWYFGSYWCQSLDKTLHSDYHVKKFEVKHNLFLITKTCFSIEVCFSLC